MTKKGVRNDRKWGFEMTKRGIRNDREGNLIEMANSFINNLFDIY